MATRALLLQNEPVRRLQVIMHEHYRHRRRRRRLRHHHEIIIIIISSVSLQGKYELKVMVYDDGNASIDISACSDCLYEDIFRFSSSLQCKIVEL